MQTGLLLIAMGFGFKVYAEASANGKKTIRQIGRLVGAFMMIVGFLGTLCIISCVVQYGKGNYGFMGGKWGGKMCPITGKLFTPDTTNVPSK